MRQRILGLDNEKDSELLIRALLGTLPELSAEQIWWRWQVAMGCVEAAIKTFPIEDKDNTVLGRDVEALVPLLTAGVTQILTFGSSGDSNSSSFTEHSSGGSSCFSRRSDQTTDIVSV